MHKSVLAVASSFLIFLSAAVAQTREPLQIVVSLDEQRMVVYRSLQTVAQTNISSGKQGHDTPTGIFSILHKRKFHRSNIYSNAPMPWMQRLTWTGIALHESDSVPSDPASHGCVRIPQGFAEELFAMTQAGEHVIIGHEMPVPFAVNHPILPKPERIEASADQTLLSTTNDPDGAAALRGTLEVIDAAETQIKHAAKPLRILITRKTRTDQVSLVQLALNKLGFDAGSIDGAAGQQTRAAITRFERSMGREPAGEITADLISTLFSAAGYPQPGNAHLYVRQGMEPLFDAPIDIDQPNAPFGIHLVVAGNFEAGGSPRWVGYSLENDLTAFQRAIFDIEEGTAPTLSGLLDRLQIPAPVLARLNRLLTPGSSIAISDTGLGPYTDWMTDFIVLTKKDKAA